MPLTEVQTQELHKFMLAYLKENKFKESFEAMKKEVKLQPVSKRNMLSSKWKSITKLTKKIQDLESSRTALTQDLSSMKQTPGKKAKRDLVPNKSVMPLDLSESGKDSAHQNPVTCVKFHPAFGVVATAGEDAAIKIWDAESGVLEKPVMMGHQDTVQCIAFHPKGKILASCSADLSIRLWDLESHQCTKTINGHEHNISCVVYTNDGEHLISCSRDKTIKIWDPKTGICRATLTGHSDWVRSLAVAPTGSLFASCSHDKTIKIWDSETKECIRTLHGHDNFVQGLAFSNGPADEVITSSEGKLLSKDVARDMRAQLLADKGGDEKKTSCGGLFLASASRDKTIKLWNVATGDLVSSFDGHTNWVQSLLFQPLGKYLVSASDDKSIRLWDLADGSEAKKLDQAHEMFVLSIDWSRNLPLFVSGACDKKVKVWKCS